MRVAVSHGSVLAWLLTGIAFCAGCASKSAPAIRAELAEDFQLHIGQSAVISAIALEVGFDAVSSDSRCAKDVTCVWEGDAVVVLWLQHRGQQRESVELHTAAQGRSRSPFDRYDLSLVALDPIPVSGRTISPSDYVVTLKVTSANTAFHLEKPASDPDAP